jgi:PTS system ascorbate-specific IIA component
MVGILIITHNRIGEEILASAETIAGTTLDNARTVSIPGGLKPDQLGLYADQVKTNLDALDTGSGVLIITDIPGATPDNLARYFSDDDGKNVIIISGLNLSMLVRIINYCDQPLTLLAKVGIVGANKGITEITQHD